MTKPSRAARALALLAVLLPAGAPAQGWDEDIRAQIESYLKARPERPFQVEVPPDAPVLVPDALRAGLRWEFQKRMALSGHGILLDIDGRRVTLSEDEMARYLAEMVEAIRREEARRDPGGGAGERLAALAKLLGEIRPESLDPAGRLALADLTVRTEALLLPDELRSAYLWRLDFIRGELIRAGRWKLPDLLVPVWVRWRDILVTLFPTAYMSDCLRAGVPVPPDFTVAAGSAWTRQGSLATNMLAPGRPAQVWTWADPARRGVCIALPREAGGALDVAGIICQGAATGNACFWDNIERATGRRIPWASEPLVINALADGSNLAENCTGCHRGNNVFLVAPDDPTWCRLLRGGRPGAGCPAPAGPNAGNLTLAVEAPVNAVAQPGTSVFHARYTPLTGTPPRPAWTNPAAPGCGGLCHLGGAGPFSPPPMPPACGTNCR